ncbi:phosphatidylserine decarboxylase [Pajaroellobacter abortibovis]|uniref:phosphatidylserine decarboxylase n=1 Tax=Pajaroellobacter abortibovis TaxID=1882918 RepID=A0A1L6MZN3_9BACT|nr:phosphatidylserine decarboxylase [Pajaroellobacter abortibovis]
MVRWYGQVYGVDLSECVQQEGWSCFDAFFTRKLRPEVRPVDLHPHGLVSPADGCLESISRIEGENTVFQVKGQPYRVKDLIGDEQGAKRYRGGIGCVIYLSPADYHRVHAPVSGCLRSVHSLSGDYYPVNSWGVRSVKQLFVRNRRVVFTLDTLPESHLGCVTLIMVAAMIVGRITMRAVHGRDVPFGLHRFDPPLLFEKGDEIGVFHLGSTVVLLGEQSLAEGWIAKGGPIRWGTLLAYDAGSGARL